MLTPKSRKPADVRKTSEKENGMKKEYLECKASVILLSNIDIIRTSPTNPDESIEMPELPLYFG